MSTPFRTVRLEDGERNADNFAPNVLVDDQQCPACDRKVDLEKEGISCRSCHLWFHGTNCKASDFIVSAPTNFALLKHAMCKTGGFASKFGKFVFICDTCETDYENKQTLTTQDNISLLDNKISSMQSNFDTQMNEMKEMITGLNLSSTSSVSLDSGISTTCRKQSAWDDTQRVDQLRHMVVIRSDESGNGVDESLLEKTCVGNGVGVHKTFQLSKSKDRAVILKSRSDAEQFKASMKQSAPQHTCDDISTKIPRISIVGLQRQYEKDELSTILKQQNEGIGTIFSGTIASEEDRTLEVLAVVPLRNNPNVFKAIVKVSNLIRSVISKDSDRLFVGLQSRCRVYDNFFILRCYNCQEFGHHSTTCDKPSAVCGHCAGIHRTEACQRKSDAGAASCVNCKAAGEDQFQHPSHSPSCPILINAQTKLKQKTPFYRQQNSVRSHHAQS